MLAELYRISWVSLLTNHTGHGSWLYENLDDIVRHLNQKHAGVIRHWVESSFQPALPNQVYTENPDTA
jgi:hypothetical protein